MKKFKDHVAALAILEQAAANTTLSQACRQNVLAAIRSLKRFRANPEPKRPEIFALVRTVAEALWHVYQESE